MIKKADDRLINTIIFFAQNTKACGKIKLFKLLYLLDFEHFKQTGKSVTGYDYQAWQFGPVPTKLMGQWGDFSPEYLEYFNIKLEKVIDFTRQTVVPHEGVEFNEDEFTPREIRLMTNLAEKYKDVLSEKMIDVTHQQNGAWDKVWNDGEGIYQAIPYDLGIEDNYEDKKAILAISERNQMRKAALALANCQGE